jgi:hypothetical protein
MLYFLRADAGGFLTSGRGGRVDFSTGPRGAATKRAAVEIGRAISRFGRAPGLGMAAIGTVRPFC